MSIIDKLVKRTPEVLGTGIPWSDFEQEAQKDVYGRLEYYKELAGEMRTVMGWADSVDWTWDVVNQPNNPKALQAWAGVQNGILGKSSIIDAALKEGKSKIAGSKAPVWQREVLRAFFSQMFSLAMRGYETHHKLLLQYAEVDASRIVNNADMVFFTMRSLNRLHSFGAFNSFKKTISVGAITPPVAAVIAVGSVAALVVIAWFVTKMRTILAQWDITDAACRAAIANPTNPELVKACREAQENLRGAGKTRGPLDTLAVFGGIGILILAVGYVLPNLKGRST